MGKSGAKYAEMLQAIYPAVKAANPNAQVLMGGIAFDYFEDQGGTFVRSFINEVLQAGGGDYFDIMNFHSTQPLAKTGQKAGDRVARKDADHAQDSQRLQSDKAVYDHRDGLAQQQRANPTQ